MTLKVHFEVLDILDSFSQHVHNSTSFCPICFAQYCFLGTYIGGPTLELTCFSMLDVKTIILWESQKVVELFCGDGSIKEAHCQKQILNLENTFQLSNRNHPISSQFTNSFTNSEGVMTKFLPCTYIRRVPLQEK
jgi:hypothetical protein